MKTILKKIARVLSVPARMLAVWLTFVIALLISRGAIGGYPAFIVALIVAGVLWWLCARQGSRRGALLNGAAMILALAPLAYILVPLASSTLVPLPDDASVQMWPTGTGRSVAVYRYPADAATDRKMALVFVHGGPGAYVRDFDRAFFASFARVGFDVVLYDQFGAGRSPLGDAKEYTHEKNISDLAAVLARVNKPTVLVGQSYGATLVTSALAREDVRKRVSHVILTEPGRIPGSEFSSNALMSEKTTLAPDATQAPSAATAMKLMAPRALLAAFLPSGNSLASQEEIINHYTSDVQRVLVSNAFCKGDTVLLETFHATRFNLIANAGISRDARGATTPDLHSMVAPVLMLLGECSYIPRGRAMEYFGVYNIARSHAIPGVGHIVWGNAKGQELTRDAIVRFIDNVPGALPNEPTRATAHQFAVSGR